MFLKSDWEEVRNVYKVWDFDTSASNSQHFLLTVIEDFY